MRSILVNIAGAMIIGGVAVYIAKKNVRKVLKNLSLRKIDVEGSASDFADSLHMAMHESGPFGTGAGTDERLIIVTMRKIPHKAFWKSVQTHYKNLESGDELWNDLKGELTPREQEIVKTIIGAMPENQHKARNRAKDYYDTPMLKAWAHRAHWSLKLFNPYLSGVIDWDELMAVVNEIPLAKAFAELNSEYRKLFGESLFAHLLEELEDEDFSRLKKPLMNKPDAKGKRFSDLIRGG